MRNLLVAVGEMKLTFEASDLEKGRLISESCGLYSLSQRILRVETITGNWDMEVPKDSPTSKSSGSADDSLYISESPNEQQLLEFLHFSMEVLVEQAKTTEALSFLFKYFGLELLRDYLTQGNGFEELPLNAMAKIGELAGTDEEENSLPITNDIYWKLSLKTSMDEYGEWIVV